MLNWFYGLSIRWKLLLGFLAVTLMTALGDRLLAARKLSEMVEIARQGGAAPSVISALEAKVGDYVLESFWEIGLEVALLLIIIWVMASLLMKPLQDLVGALRAVTQGDLTRSVQVDARDEVGLLAHSFNEVLGTLNTIMRKIDNTGKRMSQSAFQVAAISREIADVSKHEESRSGEVNSATVSLNENALSVEQHARAANERAHELENQARDGIATVCRNMEEMKQTVAEVGRASGEIVELSESAKQIHHIIDTIKEIAAQTNLLALNAAIEAARAGEQGRGFAVVADEVRKLAERTTHSAVEVSNIIDHLSDKIDQSATAMDVVVQRVNDSQTVASETVEAIDRLSRGISDSTVANRDIADASRQQIGQMQLLKSTLDQLFATLSESGIKVDTTATIGHNLFEITEELNGLMARFTFDKHDDTPVADQGKRRHPRADNNLRVRVLQSDAKVEAVSKDLSLSGMRLSVSSALPESQELTLEIFLPVDNLERYSAQQPMRVRGRVAWQRQVQGRTQVGIEFVDLGPSETARLKDCFTFYNKAPEYRH